MRPISDASFELLIQKMEGFLVLSTRFKRLLRPMLFEISYDKGVRILNFGQSQKVVWFMLSGLAREIDVDRLTLKERTLWFFTAYSFLYTTPGFFSQEPSEQIIEILQDTHLIFISYENWAKLNAMFEEANLVTEKIRSAIVISRQAHLEQILKLSTEERYLENKELLDRLFGLTKRQYIADFMGMSLDRLSKLRIKY